MEEFDDPFPGFPSTHLLVDEQNFADLTLDAVKWIQGAEGFLEDHGDMIPTNPAEAARRRPEKLIAR
jgi:hypothetical protein